MRLEKPGRSLGSRYINGGIYIFGVRTHTCSRYGDTPRPSSLLRDVRPNREIKGKREEAESKLKIFAWSNHRRIDLSSELQNTAIFDQYRQVHSTGVYTCKCTPRCKGRLAVLTAPPGERKNGKNDSKQRRG